MAVVTTKSAAITNRDANLGVLNNPNSGERGSHFNVFGKVASVSGDSANSVYRFVSVPTNARIDSVRVWSGALGGSAAMDIGVYRNTKDGGAVVDADYFASALSVVSAINGTEQSHESGVNTIANREKPLWQAVGLTADPGGTFDICGTLTAASAANVDVGISVDGSY